VTLLATGRMLIAIATKLGLAVSSADVPQAFLQSDATRPLYVKLPPGIETPDLHEHMKKDYPKSQVLID